MSLKIDRVQLEIVINNDQARKQLRALEDESRILTKEMRKLKEGTEEYAQKAARLKAIKQQMDSIYDSIGLTNLTMKELQRRQQELNAILVHMRPGTEEYKNLKAQIDAVNNRIGVLKGKANETGISLRGMADGFNRYFGMATAFLASFTGVILGFRKLVDMANEYGKSVANLSALTGLAGRELKWLSDQAKEVAKNGTDAGIKVTSGAQAIVDAYTLMGSAKPELLKNKEALDEVTQAALIMADAAQITATEAVESLANTMNQFSADASEANRYINALAAGSKEGAAAIPSLSASMTKVGPAAAAANIPVEETIGLLETLAEKGVKGELAGTQLKTALLKMQTGADDTNPAVVGLNQALENLRAKNMSAAEMVKFFGLEAYTAGQIIITGSERVDYFTKAITGTNVALEQARINTESDAAAKQRAINRYEAAAIALGEKLSPAVTVSTNAFAYLIKGITATIDFIDLLTGASKNSVDAFDKQLSAVSDLNLEIVPLLGRYDELAGKANKSAVENNELKTIIGQVAESMPFAVTQFDEYGNAISISTGRVREFIAAETDRLKVVNKQAIEELNNQLKNTEILLRSSEFRMKQVEKEGTFMISEAQNWGGRTQIIRRKATADEVADEAAKYRALLSEQNGYRSEIKRLNGDALNDEITRREKERKAAEDAEKKKQEYAGKTRAELQALADAGDAYAESLIIANNSVNDSAIEAKTAYELLNAEISKLEKKLQEQVLKGVSDKLIESTIAQINQLKDQKEIVDSIIKFYENGGAIFDDNYFKNREKEAEDEWSSIVAESTPDAAKLTPIMNQAKLEADYKLKLSKETAEGQKRILAQQLKDNLISQSEFNAKIKQINQAELDNKVQIWSQALGQLQTMFGESTLAYRVIASARAGIDTYLAATAALAPPPEGAGPLLGPILAGTTIAMGLANIAKINGFKFGQRAAGKYDVIGAEDGKRYTATYSGSPQTRIYTKPTLIAEQGGELVVDAATTRNLQMNYPGIIESIMAARVPQMASGNVPTMDPAMFQNTELLEAITKLNANLEKGVRGKWYLYDLGEAQDKLSNIESNSTF